MWAGVRVRGLSSACTFILVNRCVGLTLDIIGWPACFMRCGKMRSGCDTSYDRVFLEHSLHILYIVGSIRCGFVLVCLSRVWQCCKEEMQDLLFPRVKYLFRMLVHNQCWHIEWFDDGFIAVNLSLLLVSTFG